MPRLDFLPRRPRRAEMLWSFVALASLAAAALAVKHLPAPRAALSPAAQSQTATLSTSPAAGQSAPQVERVTIRPTGFDPAEITRREGRFILAVDNRSGLRELTLRLADGDGHPLREVRVPREQLGWRLALEARAGSYVLTEAGHPDWVCRVTITAR
jgi:hypothetical protein